MKSQQEEEGVIGGNARLRRRTGTADYRRNVPVRELYRSGQPSIQRIPFQDVSNDSLVIAPKGCNEELREHFLQYVHPCGWRLSVMIGVPFTGAYVAG